MTLDNMSSTTIVERSTFQAPGSRVTPTNIGPFNRTVTELGGKARVMELLSHSDADVRYRALISVQRLVSTPWVT